MLHDLDRLKEVNDDLGHRPGDQMLIEVSRRLKYNDSDSRKYKAHGADRRRG